jgi:hypothetical protein
MSAKIDVALSAGVSFLFFLLLIVVIVYHSLGVESAIVFVIEAIC